mmetsp:Transcript_5048/g.20717  ORF Transcript_5048/g.20717 Transcript_5048/m.20717 type:complete len:282 (+) Transcript_5048:1609-2454(+)
MRLGLFLCVEKAVPGPASLPRSLRPAPALASVCERPMRPPALLTRSASSLSDAECALVSISCEPSFLTRTAGESPIHATRTTSSSATPTTAVDASCHRPFFVAVASAVCSARLSTSRRFASLVDDPSREPTTRLATCAARAPPAPSNTAPAANVADKFNAPNTSSIALRCPIDPADDAVASSCGCSAAGFAVAGCCSCATGSAARDGASSASFGGGAAAGSSSSGGGAAAAAARGSAGAGASSSSTEETPAAAATAVTAAVTAATAAARGCCCSSSSCLLL